MKKNKEREVRLEELKETRIKIGKRLQEVRERYGLDRTPLARELGLSDNLIGQYERGISSPQPLTLVRLAKKFNTTTDYLLCKTDDPSPTENNVLEIDTLLNKTWKHKGVELTKEEKKKLYKMLKTGLSLIEKE